MQGNMVDAENYAKEIVKSAPSERVTYLIEQVRDNMTVKNQKTGSMEPVLNEETGKLPVIIRKAMAEKRKLECAPCGIWEQQMFAGCFTLREEKLVNTYELPEFAFPHEKEEGEKYGFGIYSMFGHISLDYNRLLHLGTSGIIAMIDRQLKKSAAEESMETMTEKVPEAEKLTEIDKLTETEKLTKTEKLTETAKGTEEETKNRDFLKAAKISLEGFEAFATNHVEMLLKKAQICAENGDEARRAELLRDAEALKQVPKKPARTFFEACQSAWLLHLALQITDNYLALGRPDQYLYPFLKKDLEDGTLTVEEAQEITDCFMLKFNERSQDNEVAAEMMDLERRQKQFDKQWEERKLYDIGHQRYQVRDTVDAINHWNQNIIVGGLVPETGEDATNLLTVMMLESFRRMRMTNPVLSVRLSKKTPAFLKRQVAITLKTGGGLPALYNDETIIRAYTHFGVDLKDARDYANNGCWECLLPGKTDFYFTKMNALKCMEWTLNHGRCHVDQKQEVPDQGDAAKIETFDELYRRVLENFSLVMRTSAEHMVQTQHLRSIVAPVPLLSAFLEGPIEKGKDMTQMGARFILGGVIAEGISHLIDSLTAVKKVVFEENYCSMKEIVDAIDCNFVGYEKLRVKLSSCPKYGANQEEADEMGMRLTKDYSRLMEEIDKEHPEMKFMPGIGTFSWYIAVGNGTGASADGRLAETQVASNFSPSAGAMTRGITGALLSFTKMNLDVLPLGSPLDLGMSGQYVKGEAGTARLVGLIDSFLELGGNLLTISIADAEILKAAQVHPEQYKDLRVRMGGWSAYFTMLSREQQEHHIRKAEAGIFS